MKKKGSEFVGVDIFYDDHSFVDPFVMKFYKKHTETASGDNAAKEILDLLLKCTDEEIETFVNKTNKHKIKEKEKQMIKIKEELDVLNEELEYNENVS